MNSSKDVIKYLSGLSLYVLEAYLEDINSSELNEAPAPEANSVRYQLTHLIQSTNALLNAVKPELAPTLPEKLESAETSKENYLQCLREHHSAFCSMLEKLSNEELNSAPPAHMAGYTKNLGEALTLNAAHGLMHSGQIAVLRRRLKKPIAI